MGIKVIVHLVYHGDQGHCTPAKLVMSWGSRLGHAGRLCYAHVCYTVRIRGAVGVLEKKGLGGIWETMMGDYDGMIIGIKVGVHMGGIGDRYLVCVLEGRSSGFERA